MITPVHFRRFFLVFLAVFSFTWLALVVLPWMALGHLQPMPQAGGTDILPWDASGLAHAGEKVYAANGCVYCHTQQVRAPESGADIIRGWGTARNETGDKPADITRRTYPRDYIWQGRAFLGTSRDGADLSNVGARIQDPAQLYAWLYHPETLDPQSSMPAYRFLFVTQRISGQPSADALDLSAPYAPPPGFEVVPSAAAKSLVAYLLSLSKGYHLKPDEAGVPYKPPTEDKS